MTAKRIVYLSPLTAWLDDDETPVFWCDRPAGHSDTSDDHWQYSPLSQQPALAEDSELLVILQGEAAAMTHASVPEQQLKHLDQVLPFLLEEQLATDVDKLHIVRDRHTKPLEQPSTGAGKTLCMPCLIIEQTLMTNIVEHLRKYGLHPHLMTLDCLCLPVPQHSLALAIDGHRVLLRSATGALNIEISQLSLAVEGLQQHATELALPFGSMNVYIPGSDPEALPSQTRLALEALQTDLDIELHFAASPDSLPALLALGLEQLHGKESKDKPPLNLLQGPFAPATRSRGQTGWQTLAKVAGVIFGLHLLYSGAAGWYLNQSADDLYQQSEALYREYFPADKRIVNLRTQTESHLREVGSADGDTHFLGLIGALGYSWQTSHQNALAIRQIRFDRASGRLTLDIEAPALVALDSLRQALRSNGLDAELLSANETEKGVRGRLQVRRSRG